MNPLYDHDRSQNFGNCSKILKVVQKKKKNFEVSFWRFQFLFYFFNYDLNV